MPRTRRSRRLALALTLAATILAAPVPAFASSAADPAPIGPNQTFIGEVNGQTATTTIKMVCAGPTVGGQLFGHPLGGQTVTALPTADPTVLSRGYTGSAATTINVTINPSPSTASPIVLRAWAVAVAIPISLVLPCNGTGSAQFVPEPTSPTARSATVLVRFLNIVV